VAEALCAEVLAIPVHAAMSDADADRVLEALHEALP
jgi:dTDP-4-amino-4,6-dideoxygalactose transaminase